MNQVKNLQTIRQREIVKNFDVFIFNIYLDQLCSNDEALDKFIKLLSMIKDEQKTCKFVVNSNLRIKDLIKLLSANGVVPAFYQEINSSGEKLYRLLRDKKDPFHAKLSSSCYIFSNNDRDASFINDLEIERVMNVSDADFIIVFRKLDEDEIADLLENKTKPILFINSSLIPTNSYRFETIRSYDISPFDIKNMVEKDKKCAYIEIKATDNKTNDNEHSDENYGDIQNQGSILIVDNCEVFNEKDLLC